MDADSLSLGEAVRLLAQKQGHAAIKAAKEAARAAANGTPPAASKPAASKCASTASVKEKKAAAAGKGAKVAESHKPGKQKAAPAKAAAAKVEEGAEASPAVSQPVAAKRRPSAYQRFKSQQWGEVKAQHAQLSAKEVRSTLRPLPEVEVFADASSVLKTTDTLLRSVLITVASSDISTLLRPLLYGCMPPASMAWTATTMLLPHSTWR